MRILKKLPARMRIRKLGLSNLDLRILTRLSQSPAHLSALLPLAGEKSLELISITIGQHFSKTLKGLAQRDLILPSGEGYRLTAHGKEVLRRIPPAYRRIREPTSAFASAATIILYLAAGLAALILFFISESGELLAASIMFLNYILSFLITWKGLNSPREKLTAKAIACMSLVSGIGLAAIGVESLFAPFIVRQLLYITLTIILLCGLGIAFAYLARIQLMLGQKYASFSSVALSESARHYAWLCFGAVLFCLCSYLSLHFVVSFFMIACGFSLLIRSGRMIESALKCSSVRLAFIRWFEQLSRHSRELFFQIWLEKLLGERPLTKDEIVSIYTYHFVKQKTPYFDKVMLDLSRDAWFITNLDTLLGYLLFDKRIRIIDDRFVRA
ncbi:MAG: hypothetical protein LBC99_05500 [Spirochaetota bacterium]|jgi:hypothetical protein|nr:hypothetical protein [Spirochaetota bacterium]